MIDRPQRIGRLPKQWWSFSSDDAVAAILHGVDQAFDRGDELELTLETGGDERERFRSMIASGIR